MMRIENIAAALFTQNPLSLMRLMRDWQSVTRFHFLYAALECGLLESLKTPSSKEDLIQKLGVRRPELLEALLDVGLSLGELSCQSGTYRIKGKFSRSLLDNQGDTFAAIIQANVTYYNSVYRHCAARMKGAALGNYLENIGDVVARFSKIEEPFIRNQLRDLISGKGSLRMLDVGCGSGIYLQSALKVNPHVSGIGIDIDPAVVEQAKQNLERWGIADRFKVVVGDIQVPPTDVTGTFDLITLFNILYYFPVTDRGALFQSLRDMVSPNGALVIVSTVQSKGQDLAAANLNLATSSMIGCTPVPDLEEIGEQLRKSGFDQIRETRLIPKSAMYGIVAR